MATFHIAEVNIARMKGQLNDPVMTGFVARLKDGLGARGLRLGERKRRFPEPRAPGPEPYDEINALANWSIFKPCPAT